MRTTKAEAIRRGWMPGDEIEGQGAPSLRKGLRNPSPTVRAACRATIRLMGQIKYLGLPEPTREFRFDEFRAWRFDFAWPNLMLAVEYEGGVFQTGDEQGGHTRGEHYTSDCEKYNTAALLGWTVLRFTALHIRTGEAERVLSEYFTLLPGGLPEYRISEWRKPRPKSKNKRKKPTNGDNGKDPGKAGKEAKERPGPRAIPGEFKPFEPFEPR